MMLDITNLCCNCRERFIVVEDTHTRSGYRILQDWRDFDSYEFKDWKYHFVSSPDSVSGYIVIGHDYGELKVYARPIIVFKTMHEASDWVHEHKGVR